MRITLQQIFGGAKFVDVFFSPKKRQICINIDRYNWNWYQSEDLESSKQ